MSVAILKSVVPTGQAGYSTLAVLVVYLGSASYEPKDYNLLDWRPR
jgi:hypothetical protein